MLSLKVKTRTDKEKPSALRKSGHIPAVFYGTKQKSTPVSVSQKEFEKIWKQAGESSVVVLHTGDDEIESLIQDVDVHPVTGVPRHADFFVFEKGKKLKVKIPLEFSGVSPAVKDLGGTLVKVLYDLEIEALPKDLPHNINVDISPLVTLQSVILAKDLVLPSGVSLAINPEDVVASVAEVVVEEEVVAPVDISSIEVEKKGKEAKEGAEGAEATAEAPAEPKKEKEAK